MNAAGSLYPYEYVCGGCLKARKKYIGEVRVTNSTELSVYTYESNIMCCCHECYNFVRLKYLGDVVRERLYHNPQKWISF
jgi:hypothetical protein